MAHTLPLKVGWRVTYSVGRDFLSRSSANVHSLHLLPLLHVDSYTSVLNVNRLCTASTLKSPLVLQT